MRLKRPFYVTDQRDDSIRHLTCVPESRWATFPNVKLFPDLPPTSTDCWGHRRWWPYRRGTADHSDTVWHCIQINDPPTSPPPVSQPAEWIKNSSPESSVKMLWFDRKCGLRSERNVIQSLFVYMSDWLWAVGMAILTRVGVAVSCQGGGPCKGMIFTPAMSNMR